jgi:N-acetylglucosaminyl-diphospho-decaprenol L-rhamnosyltransferase
VIEDVTLVTVSYKSGIQAEFFAQTARLFREVIIVDNDSQDDSLQAFAQHIPHARLVRLERNVGFGAGNNAGIKLASHPHVMLLNPDARLGEQEVRHLQEVLRSYPNAALVGPRVYGTDGNAHPTYRWDFRFPHVGNDYPDTWGVAAALNIYGCCMMANRENFTAMGLFDERIFMYYEEDDVALRARAHGYEVLTTPFAIAQHQGNSSSTPSRRTSLIKGYHMTRSKLIMVNKYIGKASLYAAIFRILSAAPLALTFFTLARHTKYQIKWQARWLAALDWVRGRERQF